MGHPRAFHARANGPECRREIEIRAAFSTGRLRQGRARKLPLARPRLVQSPWNREVSTGLFLTSQRRRSAPVTPRTPTPAGGPTGDGSGEKSKGLAPLWKCRKDGGSPRGSGSRIPGRWPSRKWIALPSATATFCFPVRCPTPRDPREPKPKKGVAHMFILELRNPFTGKGEMSKEG